MEKISVIVPVYNVEPYLRLCLESICAQTYQNLEILLINDGSTDHSGEICEEFQRKDERIKYYSKENEGLSKTRNFGMKQATGQYFMFVDSDDWIADTMAEELYLKIKKENAKICICDRYDVAWHYQKMTLRRQPLKTDVISIAEQKEELCSISTSAWAKLYLASLFQKNELLWPEQYYEDALVPLLLALADRITYVRKPFYYYYNERKDSIINRVDTKSDLNRYLDSVLSLFQQYGLSESYHSALEEMARRRTAWNSYQVRTVYDGQKNFQLQKGLDYLKQQFAGSGFYTEEEFAVFGSYNLLASVKKQIIGVQSEEPQEYYGFSSIVSAMAPYSEEFNQLNPSRNGTFRKNQLLLEMKREFARRHVSESETIRYVVIDFLEERYELSQDQDSFLTVSVAYEAAIESEMDTRQRIKPCSMQKKQLWEEACLKFIKTLRQRYPGRQIVLVKMYLAEQYGSLEKEEMHPDLEQIQQINCRLQEYYNYFKEHCKEAIVIGELTHQDWYYTDENFRHGCEPWHLNAVAYQQIGRRIEEKLKEDEQ